MTANRNIGVSLTADPTALQSGLSAATSAAQQFGARASEAFGRASSASDQVAEASKRVISASDQQSMAARANQAAAERYILSLDRQANSLGKTREQLLSLQAAELGVANQAAPLIARIAQLEAAQKGAADAALREAAALREVEREKKKAESTQQSFLRGLKEQVDLQGKSESEILRYKAAQMGVSQEAEKYISQLDRSSAAMSNGGKSTKEMAAAMRGVPAQITDIVVSLQGGQRPMTVLLQQGGQLKDMFGGIVPAAQALSSTFLGMLNPITLGAAAFAALATAWYQGSTEMDALNKHLVMTGNAAGVTANMVSDLASSLDSFAGVTRGGAVAVLTEIVSSGKVAAAQLEIVGEVAVRSAQLLGRETADVVAEFAKLADKPAEASRELNEQYNYLTASVYRQIAALEEQGRNDEAAALAQEAYAQSTLGRLNEVETQLNALGKVYQAAAGFAKDFWDAAEGAFRKTTTDEALRLAVTQLEQMKKHSALSLFDVTGAMQKQEMLVASLRSQKESEETAAGLSQATAEANKAAIASYNEALKGWSKLVDDTKSRIEKRDEEVANARKWAKEVGASEQEMAKVIAAINEKHKEPTTSGGVSATQTELANLRARIAAEEQRATQLVALGTAQSKLNEGEKLALSYAEKLKLATDAKTKAALEEYEALAKRLGIQIRANDEYDSELKGAESSLKKVREESRAMRDRVAVYGQSKSALQEIAVARLREREAMLVGVEGQEHLLNLIREEIAEREKLRQSTVTHEHLEAQRKEWEAWSKDVEKIFDRVGQSLTDSIFDEGKNARELLKDLFKGLVFNVVINPMMSGLQNSVTNSLGGILGYSNPSAQGGGMSGVMGMANDLSTLNTIYGTVHQALTGAAANASQASIAAANLSGMMGGDSIGTLISMNGGWQGAMSSLAAGGAALSSAAGAVSGAAAAMMPATASIAAAPAISAVNAAAAAWMPTTAGLAAGGAVGGMSAAGAAAGGAAASGMAGGATLMGTLGAALPWIGGALALGSAFGLFGDREPTTRRSNRVYADMYGSILESDSRQSGESASSAAQLAQQSVQSANRLFQQAGIDAAFESFHAIMESSIKGDRNGVASGGTLRIGDQRTTVGISDGWDQTKHGFGGWSDAEMLPRLATDIQMSVLEAFQQADLLSGVLDGVNVRGLDGAAAQALINQVDSIVTSVDVLREAFGLLPFKNLTNLTFDATAALLQLAGGVENLTGAQQTYLQNFYSEAERHEIAVNNLTSALAGAGTEMPALVGSVDEMKSAYRALVDAQDLETEAGRQAYVALMGAAGAFAEVATYAGQAADSTDALARAAEAVAQQRVGLENQILQLTGNTAELRRRELEALDPANRWLQQRIYALQDEASAAAAAAAAYNNAWAEADAALATVKRIGQADISRLQETYTRTDSLFNSLMRSADAQRKIFDEQLRLAEQTVSTLRGAFDMIGDAVRDLRGDVSSTAEMQRQYAMQVIQAAAMGGPMPESEALRQAIDAARGGVTDASQFASAFDRDFAALALAAELEKIQLVNQPELDKQEQALELARQQLEALDTLTEEAKRQLDQLRGIDTNTYVIERLTQDLQTQMAAEKQARSQIDAIQLQINQSQALYDQMRGTNAGINNLSDAMRELASKLNVAINTPKPTVPGGSSPPLVPDPNAPGNRTHRPSTYEETWAYLNQDKSSPNHDLYLAYVDALRNGDKRSATEWAQWHFDTWGMFEGRKYADGGVYPGGLALVGERGPELINFSRGGYVHTADQTADIMRRASRPAMDSSSGILQAILSENRALREENKSHAQAIVRLQNDMMRILRNWDARGVPETRELIPVAV